MTTFNDDWIKAEAAQTSEKVVDLTGYGQKLHVNDISPDIRDALQRAYDKGKEDYRSTLSPAVRATAIIAKVDLLKLKANGYEWGHVSDSVQDEINRSLKDLDKFLAS